MKIIKFLISGIIACAILVSCERRENFSITVVDKTTQQPVDSVLVKVIVKAGKKEKSANNFQGYTDSAGKFITTVPIGYGLSMKRRDFYMTYSKNGYAKKEEKNRTNGVVELEK